MKSVFLLVTLFLSHLTLPFSGYALATGYHGEILCDCNDTECIQQRSAHHIKETGLCLAGLAIEAFIPGHGASAAGIAKCALDSGITIYEVYERLHACQNSQKSNSRSSQFTMNEIINCIAGSSASSAQMTATILGCTTGIKAGSAITSCSYNIATGIVKIADNTICLGGDLKRLYDSQAALNLALDRTLRTPAPRRSNVPSRSCNDEESSCNTFGMQKFGIWLGQQSYWSYATRSYLCADMCSNKGSGSAECKANARDIFRDDLASCSPAVCGTSQCNNAIAMCVSYCCGQDNSCARTAHEKMDSYRLN